MFAFSFVCDENTQNAKKTGSFSLDNTKRAQIFN